MSITFGGIFGGTGDRQPWDTEVDLPSGLGVGKRTARDLRDELEEGIEDFNGGMYAATLGSTFGPILRAAGVKLAEVRKLESLAAAHNSAGAETMINRISPLLEKQISTASIPQIKDYWLVFHGAKKDAA